MSGNYLISGEIDGSGISGSTIEGNLQITMSSVGDFHFAIDSNNVGGNLTFNDNNTESISQLTSVITNNAIGRSLQCQNNMGTLVTSGNTAKSYEGQCQA